MTDRNYDLLMAIVCGLWIIATIIYWICFI